MPFDCPHGSTLQAQKQAPKQHHGDTTEPSTVPVEQFLALARYSAEMQRENAALKRERAATIELLLNPTWKPTAKVALYVTLNHVGAAPGRPLAARISEFTPGSYAELAHKTGISPKQFSKHMQGFIAEGLIHERRNVVDAPTRPQPAGAARSAPAPAPQAAPQPAMGQEESSPPIAAARPKREPPAKITQISLKPPDGDAWRALCHPAHLAQPEAPKLDADAEQARQKSKEARAKLAAAEAILMECGHCGCSALHMLDLRITCKNCGAITTMEDAKRPRKGKRRIARPLRREESSVSPQHSVLTAEEDSSAKYIYGSTRGEVDLPGDVVMAEESSPPIAPVPAGSMGAEESSPPIIDAAGSPLTEANGGTYDWAADHAEEILEGVADAFMPVVEGFGDHIVMQRRTSKGKYTTPKGADGKDLPLTRERLREHFLGRITVGTRTGRGDITAPSGMRTQALAWDADEKDVGAWQSLIEAARLLSAHRVYPVLSKNPTKENSGHLWIFLEEPMDGRRAILACHTLAPMLQGIAEHFPNETTTGGRIRLPCGVFPAPDGRDIPFLVACAVPQRPSEEIYWQVGTSPGAWLNLRSQFNPTTILESVQIAPELLAKPAAATATSKMTKGVQLALPREGDFDFARWCRENPVSRMVDLDRANKFLAPWREETVPSVQYYPDDGHWYDFGPHKRHGRDSFDLYCAMNGYWDDEMNRPRRGEALRALGVKAKEEPKA